MESRKEDNAKSYLFPIWKWCIISWVIEFQSRYVTEILMLARLRFQLGLDLKKMLCLTLLFYTGVLVSKADWMAVKKAYRDYSFNDAKGQIISERYFGVFKSCNE